MNVDAMTIRRVLSGLLLLAAVAASVVVSRSEVASEPAVFATSFRPGTPAILSSENSITSTWFCGGTSALGSSPEGEYGGELVIINTGDSDATALVTVLTSDQQPMAQVVTVKSKSKKLVDIDAMVKSSYASAYVEIDSAEASIALAPPIRPPFLRFSSVSRAPHTLERPASDSPSAAT